MSSTNSLEIKQKTKEQKKTLLIFCRFQNKKFLIIKSVECTSVIRVRGENGEISSPGYPKQYPPNKECSWIILAPSGKIVRLQFQDFELEKYSNCLYDYLELRDGDGPQNLLLGKFCGDVTPSRVNSSGNAMYIKFYSDGLITKRGFSLKWQAIQGPTPSSKPGTTNGKGRPTVNLR